ncbi:MAG TPA: alpha/beta hydrolase [Anaeromyxobacteraceae bacterium]|nr:alpha/beta hydrolase [Anaeromyxobacteraceae bacterium]
MLRLVHRLMSLQWRWHGAAIRQRSIAGSVVWYADFPARPERRPRSGRGRRAPRRAPTLVLFHGLGASSTSFYPVVPFLRRAYRVVVPDLPGCGASRPPRGREFLGFSELVDVAEAFVAEVAPGGAYVAGNSMGGWIATKVAARRPDLVTGMALLNPGGPALRAEDWVDFARILWAEEKGTMDEWLRRMFHRPPLYMRLFLREFRRVMKAPSVAQLMSSLRPEDFLSEAEVEKVRSPAVLVWGEKDRLIPDGCKAFYLKKLKGVRYEPVPDCGHCPQLECPSRTAQILLELPALAAARRPRGAHPQLPAGGGGGTRARTPVPRRRGGLVAVARAPKS